MDGVSIMLIVARRWFRLVGGLGHDLIQFGIVMTHRNPGRTVDASRRDQISLQAGMQKESVASVNLWELSHPF